MSSIALRLFFACILSFCFTYYLIPIFIAIARKYNIIDFPDGIIKQHVLPTPYLGGAAIYLGFLLTLAVVFPFDNQFFLFLVGSSLLFYIGLIDDLIQLQPLQKFLGQIIAVICFIRAGFYLKSHLYCNLWSMPISVLWMLLIINAFNLIDIMDGLASITALCCALNFLVLAILTEQYIPALLLCSIIGSIAAFLCFNKPPAYIYLGDAGSLFIGGLFSTIPFLFPWGGMNVHGYIIPVIALAIPLLEVCGLICIRTYRGLLFYKPSKHHFMHYLKRNHFSENEILRFIFMMSCILIVSAALFVKNSLQIDRLMVIGGGFLAYWIYSLAPQRNSFFLK